MVRKIGSDTRATRTVLAFIASLPAGKPAMVFGYLPAKQGNLQMTTASRLSPKRPALIAVPWYAMTATSRRDFIATNQK
eukprot:1161158-Pyramimonas_sp.AAC.1